MAAAGTAAFLLWQQWNWNREIKVAAERSVIPLSIGRVLRQF